MLKLLLNFFLVIPNVTPNLISPYFGIYHLLSNPSKFASQLSFFTPWLLLQLFHIVGQRVDFFFHFVGFPHVFVLSYLFYFRFIYAHLFGYEC